MEKWQDPEVILLWIILGLLLIFILISFIIYLFKINFKKNLEKKELIFNERLNAEKELKKAIITTQETERKLIASELHDQISNKLNLVVLKLSNINTNTFSEEIPLIKEDLKNLIKKNRDITHYLYPTEIDNLGLILTLQDLAIKYKTAQFKMNIYSNQAIHFQQKQEEYQIYRIIQESITNTLKHAKASEINIHLKPFKQYLSILIQDDGIGFNPLTITKGIGLTNIETRLNTLDAIFKFKSIPSKGTRLIIKLNTHD